LLLSAAAVNYAIRSVT